MLRVAAALPKGAPDRPKKSTTTGTYTLGKRGRLTLRKESGIMEP